MNTIDSRLDSLENCKRTPNLELIDFLDREKKIVKVKRGSGADDKQVI
jgi:hypothetical protein